MKARETNKNGKERERELWDTYLRNKNHLFAPTDMSIDDDKLILTSNCRSTDVVVANRASTTVMAITAEEICKLDSFMMIMIIIVI